MFVTWDIETTNVEREEGKRWWKTPPRITCASTMVQGQEPIVWHGRQGASIADEMSVPDLDEMFFFLRQNAHAGHTIVTVNGVSFDWPLLAYHTKRPSECISLCAYDHVDLCFTMLALKGWPVGLDALAKGLGVGAKMEGMDGQKAAEGWHNPENRPKILEYVASDATMTMRIIEEISHRKAIAAISKRSGKTYEVPLSQLLTVSDCLNLPLPDTSWMDHPWPREGWVWWMFEPDLLFEQEQEDNDENRHARPGSNGPKRIVQLRERLWPSR